MALFQSGNKQKLWKGEMIQQLWHRGQKIIEDDAPPFQRYLGSLGDYRQSIYASGNRIPGRVISGFPVFLAHHANNSYEFYQRWIWQNASTQWRTWWHYNWLWLVGSTQQALKSNVAASANVGTQINTVNTAQNMNDLAPWANNRQLSTNEAMIAGFQNTNTAAFAGTATQFLLSNHPGFFLTGTLTVTGLTAAANATTTFTLNQQMSNFGASAVRWIAFAKDAEDSNRLYGIVSQTVSNELRCYMITGLPPVTATNNKTIPCEVLGYFALPGVNSANTRLLSRVYRTQTETIFMYMAITNDNTRMFIIKIQQGGNVQIKEVNSTPTLGTTWGANRLVIRGRNAYYVDLTPTGSELKVLNLDTMEDIETIGTSTSRHYNILGLDKYLCSTKDGYELRVEDMETGEYVDAQTNNQCPIRLYAGLPPWVDGLARDAALGCYIENPTEGRSLITWRVSELDALFSQMR
jgi:hypothetical protein